MMRYYVHFDCLRLCSPRGSFLGRRTCPPAHGPPGCRGSTQGTQPPPTPSRFRSSSSSRRRPRPAAARCTARGRSWCCTSCWAVAACSAAKKLVRKEQFTTGRRHHDRSEKNTGERLGLLAIYFTFVSVFWHFMWTTSSVASNFRIVGIHEKSSVVSFVRVSRCFHRRRRRSSTYIHTFFVLGRHRPLLLPPTNRTRTGT